MNSFPNAHLSEDVLDTVVLDTASKADLQHLAACEVCTARLTDFRTSLAMFNQASAGWSQARSNTISRELPTRQLSHTSAAAWSLASVAFLAVGLAIGTQVHRSPDLATSSTPAVEQAATLQQEIASDNAMLVAIDSKISEPVPSPLAAEATRQANKSAPHMVHD